MPDVLSGGADTGEAGDEAGVPQATLPSLEDVLAGGGTVGTLMRAKDWSATPLGPVAEWPQSLRTAVSICLASRFPIVLWWGPQFILLYNDAYAPILGEKHPAALGAPGREVWSEIWHIIGPMLEGVISRAEATWSYDQMLPLHRHGFTEECYFTFTYSPIRDETGGVGGVFCAVIETTERVLGERRLATLRSLAAVGARATSAEDACGIAARVLGGNAADVPFALVYLVDAARDRLVLTAATGSATGEHATPTVVPIDDPRAPRDDGVAAWPLRSALHGGRVILVDDVRTRVGPIAAAPWPDDVHTAVVAPLTRAGEQQPWGVMVAGLSPRLRADAGYRDFLALVAGQVAAAIASARAREEERRRLEALAELDRAKTAFFSNVSHEFRTPLTLLLGPLESAMQRLDGASAATREELEVAHRNALRMLRLVNSLLDFARVEAGRMDAVFAPTDLAALTADLASTFRSACERAGLALVVDAPPLASAAWVDRALWERIVFNLLSNALKHTFEGEIAVSVRQEGDRFVLPVRDTGVGIPAEQQARIFERFHRVASVRSRSHEGTGIGLALVQELVRLHGGSVEVESEEGRGSTFTVTIPAGHAHLPADRLRDALVEEAHASVETRAAPWVQEALRWLPDEDDAADATHGGDEDAKHAPGARILLADDNADMRAYLARLLREQGWQVETVGDGAQALAAARERAPDLVLSDVMMPALDGLALVRELRADPALATTPVILLSARAGEESRVEGSLSGADDYLVKPFAAPELVARVRTHLALAAERRHALATIEATRGALERLFAQLPSLVAVFGGDKLRCEMANPMFAAFFGGRALLERPIADALPELRELELPRLLARVRDTGVPHVARELPVRVARAGSDVTDERFLDIACLPVVEPDAGHARVLVHATDVTTQVRSRHDVERARERLRLAVQAGRVGTWEYDVASGHLVSEGAVDSLFGFPGDRDAEPSRPLGQFLERIDPDDVSVVMAMFAELAAGREARPVEARVRLPDGRLRWVAARGEAVRDAGGRVGGLAGAIWDVSDQREQERDQRFLAELGAALQGHHDPMALVGEATRRVAAHLGADRVTLSVVHADADSLEILGGWRNDGIPSSVGHYPLREMLGPLYVELASGRTVMVEDAMTDARMRDVWPRWYRAIGTRALVSAPLERYGRWTAMLSVVSAAPRLWSRRDVDLVRAAGERLWPAYDAARALAAERAARDRTQRLQELTAALTVAATERDVADVVLRQGMLALGAVAGGVCLLTGDGTAQRLVAVFVEGVAVSTVEDWTTFPLSEPYPVNEAVLRQQIVTTTSFEEYRERWPQLAAEMKWTEYEAYVAAPLLIDGRAVGSVNYNFADRRTFDGADRAFIETLTRLASQAMQRAWLFEAERAARAEAELARLQAEAANRAKTDFLAAMSHELRTPLNAIQGHTQLLEMELHGPVTAAQREALGRIARSQRSLLMLINDVLNLARIEAGHVTYDMADVPVHDVVHDIGALIEPQLAARALHYEVRMPAEPVIVRADRQKFEQILLNLLSNAIKFTPEGGRVTVEIGRRATGDDPPGFAWIRVSDTGRGIPRGKLESIFEPFVQVEARRAGTSEGVGLGLAISRDLARGMGGDLRARSEHRAGATFTLTLAEVRTSRETSTRQV